MGRGPLRSGLPLLLAPLVWAAAADTPPVLSLEELTAQSDAIVSGRVTRTWAGMDPENRFIWTHYEITVRDTLKGPAHATIVISEPGGFLNGVHLQVSGSTHFADGEDVAVFLYRTPIGYMRTTNYGQGKLTFAPGGALRARQAPSLDGVSWSAFRARVAHILAQQREAHR
jgi:hypothetical protein